jgi:tRNA G10  N-methylase Trm11
VHSGKTKVYGSDISEHMVDISIENLKALMTRFAFDYDVQKLNAKFVDEFSSIKEVDSIVTE